MGRQNDCYQNKHMYFGFLDHLTTMPPRSLFVRTTTWKPCDQLIDGELRPELRNKVKLPLV